MKKLFLFTLLVSNLALAGPVRITCTKANGEIILSGLQVGDHFLNVYLNEAGSWKKAQINRYSRYTVLFSTNTQAVLSIEHNLPYRYYKRFDYLIDKSTGEKLANIQCSYLLKEGVI